jgi:hypothetical protein
MNRIPLDIADPYQHTALNAIGEVIDETRRRLATYARQGRADLAHDQALRLRKLEHAARQMGENLDRYLPACYRNPAETAR